jgi:bloom syndrome protein
MVILTGHDFRPDYQRLSFLREELPDVPIVALTATATRTVQGEIIRSLRLRDPLVVRTTVNRPNIHYTVKASVAVDNMM